MIHGCSIVFVNPRGQVLLLLRDDIPQIPFPGCWDLPGGHLETGETPQQCIVREMREEMELELSAPELYRQWELSDRSEHMFWTPLDRATEAIALHEGQRVQWFERDAVLAMQDRIAFGFGSLLAEFFRWFDARKK